MIAWIIISLFWFWTCLILRRNIGSMCCITKCISYFCLITRLHLLFLLISWLITITKHWRAVFWSPLITLTPSLIVNLTFTCRVDGMTPKACIHGYAKIIVYGENAFTIMKFTITSFPLATIGNLIYLFGTTIFPSNSTSEGLYFPRSSEFKSRPL